ncbi:hypothetical protein F511_21901 [Dorcoceras hygrometricum]|uniref:Uncharacterized protein n=1 Tax=Dorcoceras hygrometricum TaxID=472368 RepID=A0A2Z7BDY3_9LAMI|nr:hypothetical protein F511_21901 [Dorcoceras hygrometricum]
MCTLFPLAFNALQAFCDLSSFNRRFCSLLLTSSSVPRIQYKQVDLNTEHCPTKPTQSAQPNWPRPHNPSRRRLGHPRLPALVRTVRPPFSGTPLEGPPPGPSGFPRPSHGSIHGLHGPDDARKGGSPRTPLDECDHTSTLARPLVELPSPHPWTNTGPP